MKRTIGEYLEYFLKFLIVILLVFIFVLANVLAMNLSLESIEPLHVKTAFEDLPVVWETFVPQVMR